MLFLFLNPIGWFVLEEIDNGGAVPGTTYRLYAELSEGILYVMYANELNPHLIETTTTFFNRMVLVLRDFKVRLIPVLGL